MKLQKTKTNIKKVLKISFIRIYIWSAEPPIEGESKVLNLKQTAKAEIYFLASWCVILEVFGRKFSPRKCLRLERIHPANLRHCLVLFVLASSVYVPPSLKRDVSFNES